MEKKKNGYEEEEDDSYKWDGKGKKDICQQDLNSAKCETIQHAMILIRDYNTTSHVVLYNTIHIGTKIVLVLIILDHISKPNMGLNTYGL
jgi:hypothetical protein